jgi:hypothetical protein
MVVPENIRNDPQKNFEYMSKFYKANAQNLYKQQKAQFTSQLRQSLIDHRPFDTTNGFRANERFLSNSKYQNIGSYVSGLRDQAQKLKMDIRSERDLKVNRWPYILGD